MPVVPILAVVGAATGATAAVGAGIASAIGLGTVGTIAATAIGSAALAGVATAVQGGDAGDVLKSAVLGGVGSFVGGTIGEAVFGSAASGVSQAALDAANATADPIAAINAIQGWTTSDIGYLASIGASQAIIDAAVANNTALTDGTATPTNIPESAIVEANLTNDPIAALNASQGWTVSDIGYMYDIGATKGLIDAAITNNLAMGVTPSQTDLGIQNWMGLDPAIQEDLLNRGVSPTLPYKTADGGWGYSSQDGSFGWNVSDVGVGDRVDLMMGPPLPPELQTPVTTPSDLPSGTVLNTDGSTTTTFDDGTTLTSYPDGTLTSTSPVDGGTVTGPISDGPTTVMNPDGSTTQTFDDGSTLITQPDGSVTSTDATDVVMPVTTPSTGSGSGRPDTEIFDDGSTLTTNPDGSLISTPATNIPTAGDLGAATWSAELLNSLGLGGLSSTQILGLMAAGALAPSALQALGIVDAPVTATGPNYGDRIDSKLPKLTEKPLTLPGLNPGLMPVERYYETTRPEQPQYYWGVKPYVQGQADLAKMRAEGIPGAPEKPFGFDVTVPGSFDVNEFIRQTINPQQSQAIAGAGGNYQIYTGQPAATAPTITAPVVPTTPVVNAPVTSVNPADVIKFANPDLVNPASPLFVGPIQPSTIGG